MSDLPKTAVRALLRLVQSDAERFASSQVLASFIDDYGIGRRKGAGCLFDAEDKACIRELLRAEGIDPLTDPAAWDQITRAEALRLGPDEKFAATPVKRQRVAIKTLPGRSLNLDGRALILPPACHLDVDGGIVAGRLAHETVLLVENWEPFNRIHAIDLDLSPAGTNPLVVWRGDCSETSPEHALALLRALDVRVWAFVDYDPAGLLIAAGLPRLAGIIAPEPARLERDLAQGLTGRYQDQLPMSMAALDTSGNQHVRALWTLIRRQGRALPQEFYLS
ncbi:hypothetical protein CKO25_14530 [Thiocapsa imhoffii]|uniref:DUF7281 domain-containing protein n=1 Tax=Thiocapsa imhoffii TaxID=382777 RepID=A0A9X0WJQ7_9GAMM|nr:hypothetical protein [Thiocapsa imhoffii]MBK1645848.1 hypothetical protein [Thiocapsa imhoffii]